ncbi:uncharacterized protein C20orf96 homolog isoform X1 [Pseudorasbora parva]|uniref:uncharacterized protein C20orf96 homolog isoform X1 n=1 Tax=Pseudorasbora parva TaxID=51549 RepID=UPI00351EBF38
MSRQEMMLNFHPVDYREWERSTRPKPVLWATLHHKTVRIRTSPTGKSGKSQNAVQNGFTTLPKLSTRRASEKVEQGQITSERKDNIKVLMLLIKSRKEAIKDLEEHCEQLQERNLQIARSIKNTDRHSVSGAKELLIQNDQMWRSMVALKKWDGSLIKCAKAELTDTEEMSHTHLNGLQKQLDMVKAEVVKAQKELRFLRTYKDMEFPVKALQIADMKRKLDRLKQMQQEEQEDVNQLFEKEMVRLERFQRQREQEVMSAVLEKHESHVPPIAKLIASQNYTRREEINMRRKVIMELEQKNEELMKSIQELQLSRPNIRREIFPDVFLKSDKCTPDMDVHLNIPQEDLLPV